MNKYICNPSARIDFNGEIVLTQDEVLRAITLTNDAIRKLYEQTSAEQINIFEILGMRNLSGVVGEYFGRCTISAAKGKLHSNLHQDGYPDLMLINSPEKKAYLQTLYTEKNGKKYPNSKSEFSPFLYGGLEVKATCGSVPQATESRPKPIIGEQRIQNIKGFDWKAHHRGTNNLLAVLWDFIDAVPTIVACFYRSDLTEDDWGKIVQPKEGGGRTTSVSVMSKKGVKRMCEGWVAVMDDPIYTQHLAKKKWIGFDVRTLKA